MDPDRLAALERALAAAAVRATVGHHARQYALRAITAGHARAAAPIRPRPPGAPAGPSPAAPDPCPKVV